MNIIYIEKNIYDNIIDTVLNISRKIKDSTKAHLDLQKMRIQSKLHLVHRGERFFMPPACYLLFGEEKKNFCGWFKIVKLPDTYASNVSQWVGNNDGNISDMKSHDSHVMMQHLLPMAMNGYLGGDGQTAMIELGGFFQELCYQKLKMNLLERLEKDIVLILCKLEKNFSPLFFDVIVHLAVYLSKEALLIEPVYYR